MTDQQQKAAAKAFSAPPGRTDLDGSNPAALIKLYRQQTKEEDR